MPSTSPVSPLAESPLTKLTSLVEDTAALIPEVVCDEARLFWKTFLKRCSPASSENQLSAIQSNLNNLSPDQIAALPAGNVRTEWTRTHRQYLDTGDTSEGMLSELPLGVERAWRKLEQRYLPMIRSQIVRISSHPSHVDYIAQDVLIRIVELMQREERFERRRHGSFRKWIKQVSWYVIQEYEKDQQLAGNPTWIDLSQWMNSFDDVDSWITREWLKACLTSCLEVMEEEARQKQTRNANSVALRDFEIFKFYSLPKWTGESISADQIAADFGVDRSLVYTIDGRMKAQFRSILIAQGWKNDL